MGLVSSHPSCQHSSSLSLAGFKVESRVSNDLNGDNGLRFPVLILELHPFKMILIAFSSSWLRGVRLKPFSSGLPGGKDNMLGSRLPVSPGAQIALRLLYATNWAAAC